MISFDSIVPKVANAVVDKLFAQKIIDEKLNKNTQLRVYQPFMLCD